MSEIKYPTCKKLREEDGLVSILRESDDAFRHGSYITEVFFRESDNTYWEAIYCFSTDGETNGLMQDEADIVLVEPYTVTSIKYRPVITK